MGQVEGAGGGGAEGEGLWKLPGGWLLRARWRVQEEVQPTEQDFGNFQVGGLNGAGEGCRRRRSS